MISSQTKDYRDRFHSLLCITVNRVFRDLDSIKNPLQLVSLFIGSDGQLTSKSSSGKLYPIVYEVCKDNNTDHYKMTLLAYQTNYRTHVLKFKLDTLLVMSLSDYLNSYVDDNKEVVIPPIQSQQIH